jgi:hypothetical protein
MVAKKARHDGIGRMIELQDLCHQIGAGLQQRGGMHWRGLSHAGIAAPAQ